MNAKAIYNRISFFIAKCRAFFWSRFSKKFGRNVYLLSGVKLLSPEGITLGDYVSINHDTSLGGHGGLEIGNFVNIGPNCNLITANHKYSDWSKPMAFQGITNGPIKIEDDVWLGANVVVLPNVVIGRGSIVAANAVVSKNVEPYSIVGGVPAKLIKYRFDGETIKKAKEVDLSKFTFSHGYEKSL